jgi:hypothetical protein
MASHPRKDDLWQLKTGAAALATCIVRTLDESDHTFEERFLKNLERAYDEIRQRHQDRDVQDVAEMLSWTRELLTGWNFATGQGDPLLPRRTR